MPSQTARQTMDAIELLKADHQRIQELFQHYRETDPRAYKMRHEIALRVFRELETHSRLEEEVFYPALQDATDAEGYELLDEAYEEHHVVDMLISELRAMEPEDPRFDAKFTVLCENVQHHVEEEEGEMLPDARRALHGELDELGDALRERRRQIMTAEV